MINPYCFFDRALKVGFFITPDSQHISRSNSEITIKPHFLEFGTELKNNNNIL